MDLGVEDGVTKTGKLDRPGFRMLVQLEGIIARSMNMTVFSKKVKNEYLRLVTTLAPELQILTKLAIEEIAKSGGSRIAEGVRRVRARELSVTPGFDNTYGIVKIWEEDERSGIVQAKLFN